VKFSEPTRNLRRNPPQDSACKAELQNRNRTPLAKQSYRTATELRLQSRATVARPNCQSPSPRFRSNCSPRRHVGTEKGNTDIWRETTAFANANELPAPGPWGMIGSFQPRDVMADTESRRPDRDFARGKRIQQPCAWHTVQG